MRVLWICNQCVPQIAEELNIPSSNKEGWIAGLYEALRSEEERFTLGIAFPYAEDKNYLPQGIRVYGFVENTEHPEYYDERTTERIRAIIDDFRPDIVHVFGTEYGHTLSAAKALNCPSKLLIGFQGVCSALSEAYLTGVDEKWIHRATLRDRLKDDNLIRQKEKFAKRAEHEKEALQLAGYVTGRTKLDREYAKRLNPEAEYLSMNETMRKPFYEGQWDSQKFVKHSVFVSQCDYPIKGFHILIKALSILKEEYSDISVRVAGNTITGEGGLKKRILISTYGKYLRHLLKQTGTDGMVRFLGKCTAEEMKKEYLSCAVFVLPSVMENSPNCLGEAMLLGVPCVASNVGGVSDILAPERNGILYDGNNPVKLAEAIKEMFRMTDEKNERLYGMLERSRTDAAVRHDGNLNCKTLMSVYETIMLKQETASE